MGGNNLLTTSINDARTEATIEIDGKRIVVSTAELEQAIAALGNLRAQMLPRVPTDPPATTPLHKAENFLWQRLEIGHPPTKKGARLQLRSLHFGWLEIGLSPQDCETLVGWLQSADSFVPQHIQVN